jgi:hypothetical protein
MIGKPQITFGIKLKYIESLFRFISKKYNELLIKYEYSKNIKKYFYRYKYFQNSIEYINSENLLKKYNSEIYNFLLLLCYQCLIINDDINSELPYFKSAFVLKLRTNLDNLFNDLKNRYDLKDYLDYIKVLKLLLLNNYVIPKDIQEWEYPYKDNYNIFIELRDVKKFILLCDKDFYINNLNKLLKDTIKQDKKDIFEKIKDRIQYPFKDNIYLDLISFVDDQPTKDKIADFYDVSIDYLPEYCNAFIDILEHILNNHIEYLLHPDYPEFSFGKI